MSVPRRPLVEILYFDGCPNHEPAQALVTKVTRELALEPELRLIRVAGKEDAERLRFLGSPTIRVDGVDVDPQTPKREQYALCCRIFTTADGAAGLPEERWVRDALLAAAASERDPVAQALRAAAIPNGRRGRERTARLGQAQRELYRWILRRFAQGAPPTSEQLDQQAGVLGLEPSDALATLAREDLVHTDGDGAVRVAYPFSARPRGHRVTIDGRVTVEAMCAIDALGIAPMLELPAEISSHDPITAAEIHVHVEPKDGAQWHPEEAVVLAGTMSCDGPSFGGCCDILNFFESAASAQRYLERHPDVGGNPISIPIALEAGRAIFAEIFSDA